jgi:hypothetical protein
MISVALATCAALPDGWEDDRLLADELRSRGAGPEFAVWDDAAVDWSSFDRVVIRSTWDYMGRREEFIAWARSIGARLDNPAPVLEWNSDKRYLSELAASGVPTVPTRFVEPGDPVPALEGEVVVKPTISAGARDTGRFGSPHHAAASALIERLQAGGRTAMVQPYLGSVEGRGETAIVSIDGTESHVLRKGAVLRPDEEAPLRDDSLGAAEAMYDPGLVEAGHATAAERQVSGAVGEELVARFGAAPLYARVDVLGGEDGEPVLLELEVVEPTLYMATAPGSAARVANAILRRTRRG